MTNIHKLPNAKIEGESGEPNSEIIKILRDALTRAKRGEIRAVALFAIELHTTTRIDYMRTVEDAHQLMVKAQLFIHGTCQTIMANASYLPMEVDDESD